MALIKCPECGKQISDKANVCPNCGYPISSQNVIEEFSFSVGNSMDMKTAQDKIRIEYIGETLLEAPFNEFVLTWDNESEEYGKINRMTVFSHPNCDKPFKISSNAGTDAYEKQLRFINAIVHKYFKKDIQNDYYIATAYASKHCELNNAKKINEAINQTIHNNMPEKTEDKFYESEYFCIVMLLLFWPIGLYLMYKYHHFKSSTRVVLTVLCVLLVLYFLI